MVRPGTVDRKRSALKRKLIAYLADNSDINEEAYALIKDGVMRMHDVELIRLCRKYELLPRKKRSATFQWPVEIRFIYEMNNFGMDKEVVIEMLKEEFDNLTEVEILHAIDPYKTLAAQWYEHGSSMTHGLIQGWVNSVIANR